MLTLSELAAERQAVLKLGGSRVMVIKNTDKKKERKEGRKEKKERKLETKKNYTVNINNKYVDLNKENMRCLCKSWVGVKRLQRGKEEKVHKLYLGKKCFLALVLKRK